MTQVADSGERAVGSQAVEFDFDHHSSKMTWSPHDVWHRMQRECPVAHSPAHDGYYVLSRHEDVQDALADTATFSSAQGTTVPAHQLHLIPEDVDPPLHHQYRSIINKYFTPKEVKHREPWLREVAGGILDRLIPQRTFDIAQDFAFPFPRMVTLDLLGLPQEDEPDLSRWTDAFCGPPTDAVDRTQAGTEFLTYLMEFAKVERAREPSDTIASSLIRAQVDGRPLDDGELISFLMVLVIGGLHTTTSAISSMFVWLADHPEDWARLRADPSLMLTAVDEFVRHASPTPYTARITTRDTEVRGCPIPKGSWVLLGLGPANFDAERFERVDEAILDRQANHHMGFGLGPHRCVGAHLAKLEMKVALDEFMKRVDSYRIADHAKLAWVGGGTRGLSCVPIEITDD